MAPAQELGGLQKFAIDVVRRLRAQGFIAFFAGGCVRDRLLGRNPKDFDVATSAKPEEVREVFGRRQTVGIGASFGVIAVLGPKRLQVEVASFRSDGVYSDGRHPDQITFSTPKEDAARRDFTINGMFFDPIDNQLIDYVGGEGDLKNQVIRAIGDPLARITEDRLRMLRAVRFAATYRFQIDEDTMSAVQSQAPRIRDVSQERITAELLRMLEHPHRSRAMQLLKESQLLRHVLPFDDDFPLSAWARLLGLLESASVTSAEVALSAVVGADGLRLGEQDVEILGRNLKLSNEQRKSVIWTTKHRSTLQGADQAKLSQIQPLLIQPYAEGCLALLEAVAEVDDTSTAAIERCRSFLELSPEEQNPEPLLRGEDLMRLGFKPGPDFARILRATREAQLDAKISNQDEAIAFVERLRANEKTGGP